MVKEKNTSRVTSWLLGLVALAVIANTATIWWATDQQEKFTKRLKSVEAAIDLFRYEARDHYDGFGINALMSHLIYWAPKLQVKDSTINYQRLNQRMENILFAMTALGSDVYPVLERTIIENKALTEDPATNDEVRKWVLKACLAADSKRGPKLVLDTLIANRFKVTFRLRFWAAQELVSMGEPHAKLAGQALADIMLTEASRSPDTKPKTGHLAVVTGKRPPYFNFITPLVDSKLESVERTLLMLLGKPRQELMVLNNSVKALGSMQSSAATKRLQQLFVTPPIHLQSSDALLRVHCLDALDKIMGPDVLPFLQRVEKQIKAPMLRRKLLELKNRYQ